MKVWKSAALLAAGMIVGCMAGSPPLTARPESPAGGSTVNQPLVIDRTDMRLGTSVYFSHVPNASEVSDLRLERGLAHVIVTLDAWPDDVTTIGALTSVPEESDVIVILPGYPPSNAAADTWNYIGARLRLVVLVNGPPASPVVLDQLNEMRHLERVIATMDQPNRTGFERLQRPLSFRKVMG